MEIQNKPMKPTWSKPFNIIFILMLLYLWIIFIISPQMRDIMEFSALSWTQHQASSESAQKHGCRLDLELAPFSTFSDAKVPPGDKNSNKWIANKMKRRSYTFMPWHLCCATVFATAVVSVFTLRIVIDTPLCLCVDQTRLRKCPQTERGGASFIDELLM